MKTSNAMEYEDESSDDDDAEKREIILFLNNEILPDEEPSNSIKVTKKCNPDQLECKIALSQALIADNHPLRHQCWTSIL